MSDKLKETFEKHCSRSYFGDDEVIGYLTFDQFEAAVRDLMPSDEEIQKEAVAFSSHSHKMFGYWLKNSIIGDDKPETT